MTLAVVGVMQMLLYPLLYCVLTVAYYDLGSARKASTWRCSPRPSSPPERRAAAG